MIKIVDVSHHYGLRPVLSHIDLHVPAGQVVFAALLAAMVRVAIYCGRVAPPFSVFGRVTSRRMVVPQFDRVFITPLLILVVAVSGGLMIKYSGRWYAVVESCVIALLSFLLVGGGPTLRSWLLTGQHRFRVPARATANQRLSRPL